jgi:hypothetical protein
MAEIEVLLDFGVPYVRLDNYNDMRDRYWAQAGRTQDVQDELDAFRARAEAEVAALRARVAELEARLLDAEIALQEALDPHTHDW